VPSAAVRLPSSAPTATMAIDSTINPTINLESANLQSAIFNLQFL
jgi:hypothetical protein